MDTYSDYMMAGYGIQSVSSFASAYMQAEALRTQGEYQRSMSNINAKFAKIKADDAINSGEKAASHVKKQGRQVAGKQRAALAAQGIDVDFGSASDVQRDSEEEVAKDVMKIRNNAWRTAWGFTTQSDLDQGQSKMNYLASMNQANSTILTGGLQSVGYGMRAAGIGTRRSLKKSNADLSYDEE
jgi:hypothetical protein